MAKSKRKNYLIDKPFQLGFIFKYLVVILITVFICFGVTALYFYYDNLFGDNKLNESIIIKYNGPMKTEDGNYLFNQDDLKVTVYKTTENGVDTYKIYRPYDSNTDEKYLPGNEITLTDKEKKDLKVATESKQKVTQRFFIVIYPLLYTCGAIMLIIALYSLFFSHRMAGPVYRMRVSLDRMLAGDFDFKIKVRKTDFFRNIVEKLELLRMKVKGETSNKDDKK